MKKILATLTLIGLLAVPAISLADTVIPEAPETGISNITDVLLKMDQVGDWIFAGLMILAAIFLVIAGYLFVTARGSPEQINKARQMLINALIGVAVGVASKGLVALIESIIAK